MTINVTPLTIDDKHAWQTLYRQYAEFYKMPMSDETLATVWKWIFDKDEQFFGMAARQETGDVVGIMHFRAMRSPLRGSTLGFLDDLYVSRNGRGCGVVDAMFAALKVAGKEQGWPVIRWITAEDNYRARSAYDRLADKTHWMTYQINTD